MLSRSINFAAHTICVLNRLPRLLAHSLNGIDNKFEHKATEHIEEGDPQSEETEWKIETKWKLKPNNRTSTPTQTQTPISSRKAAPLWLRFINENFKCLLGGGGVSITQAANAFVCAGSRRGCSHEKLKKKGYTINCREIYSSTAVATYFCAC